MICASRLIGVDAFGFEKHLACRPPDVEKIATPLQMTRPFARGYLCSFAYRETGFTALARWAAHCNGSPQLNAGCPDGNAG